MEAGWHAFEHLDLEGGLRVDAHGLRWWEHGRRFREVFVVEVCRCRGVEICDRD